MKTVIKYPKVFGITNEDADNVVDIVFDILDHDRTNILNDVKKRIKDEDERMFAMLMIGRIVEIDNLKNSPVGLFMNNYIDEILKEIERVENNA